MIVCIRHNILGIFPWKNRWHIHVEKDTKTVSSADYQMIYDLQLWARDSNFWTVETFE